MAFSLKVWVVVAVLVPLLGAAKAIAVPVIAYNNPAIAGNQAHGTGLGLDFDVVSIAPITVTRLGVYDDNANGIAVGTTLNARVFDRNTGLTVGPLATFTNASPGALVGGQRLIDIVDFELGPGQYSIVAWGFNANDQNGNDTSGPGLSSLNTGGGLISFVGLGRYGFTAGAFPTNIDGGPVNRYRAGTFEFVEFVLLPEPSTFVLWGCFGFAVAIGSAWYRGRRRRDPR